MITFSNIKRLAEQLESLVVINTKEQASAVNCIKIEQVSSKITKFTTYEPKVGVFTRHVLELDPNCLGDTGDVYLTDAKEFIDTIKTMSKTGCKYLSITVEEGMLIFYDNYTEDFTTNTRDYVYRHSISLYQGDWELDFNPPYMDFDVNKGEGAVDVNKAPYCRFINQELLGVCPAESFDNLVKVITDAGQYNDANETYEATKTGNGRLILLTTYPDKVELFSLSKNYSVMYKFDQPSTFKEDTQLVIEGRHFNRLKNFILDQEPVEVFRLIYDEVEVDGSQTQYQWINVCTKYNSICFRVMEYGQQAEILKYYDAFKDYQNLESFSVREVNKIKLNEASTRLKNQVKKGQLKILFIEDDVSPEPKFIVKDADIILSSDEYRLPITYTDSEPLAPIVLTADILDSIFLVLRVYDEATKVNQFLLELKLGLDIKIMPNSKTIERFILFTQPVNCNDISILCLPRNGVEFINLISEEEYEKIQQ